MSLVLFESALSPLLAAGAAGYLLGSIPFGLLLARVLKGIDVRDVGSGNIGATNTMRALGKGWGVVAFALDFLKGWFPVYMLAPLIAGDGDVELARLVAGSAAVLGHCFPLYLRFKGGKGVSTGCGAIVAVDPLVFILGGAVWLLMLPTSRMVSLASIAMGLAFPVVAWVRHPEDGPFIIGCALLALLVVVRHRTNIARILAGTESRIGRKEPSKQSNG